MNAEHEAHLGRLLAQITADINQKYRKGQAEHGGCLWLKPGMLDNAIEEVLDLAVYLYTLREQQQRAECGYDAHQASATLFRCRQCGHDWYRTNPQDTDAGLCRDCTHEAVAASG